MTTWDLAHKRKMRFYALPVNSGPYSIYMSIARSYKLHAPSSIYQKLKLSIYRLDNVKRYQAFEFTPLRLVNLLQNI